MWCGQRVPDPCAGQGADQSTVPIVPYARQGRRMLQLVTLGMREQGCWRGKNLPQQPHHGLVVPTHPLKVSSAVRCPMAAHTLPHTG